jgi:hypothetical protein
MGDVKAYPYILYVEMANCLGLLPSTLSKIMLSKEKKSLMQNLNVRHRPRKERT